MPLGGFDTRAVSTHSRPKAAGICLFGLPRRHRCFNTQPPEGGWRVWYIPKKNRKLFQHTAARRRLGWATATVSRKRWFQHTAARRRLVKIMQHSGIIFSFNTQPPEGGWVQAAFDVDKEGSFNTQPPEGGWRYWAALLDIEAVSTHSRPKAAGLNLMRGGFEALFQHTAARRRLDERDRINGEFASFNTQPPEGGWPLGADARHRRFGFQHTAARRRLDIRAHDRACRALLFQHTAARRRLVAAAPAASCYFAVSTHSRPKAAGATAWRSWRTCTFQHTAARRRLGHHGADTGISRRVSTHSRPKAAGRAFARGRHITAQFQHTAARRRLAADCPPSLRRRLFQHTAARRRLGASQIRRAKLARFQHTAARRRLGVL